MANIGGKAKSVHYWCPLIVKYQIFESRSPLEIEYDNRKISITSHQKFVSGEIRIKYENTSYPPICQLFPRNLVHRAKHLNQETILWEIEGIQNENKYSIEFECADPSFKISHVDLKLVANDIISSGLVVSITDQNSVKSFNRESVIKIAIDI